MTKRVDAVVGRALVACVAGEREAEIEHVIALGLLHRLIAAARYHRVLNLVHLAMEGRPGVDEELAAGMKRYYLHQVGHHLRAMEDLATLSEAFGARAIPWLLVKGPVLSEVIYERPDLRVYHDLDVVIPRDAFPAAIDTLQSSGFELLDRNWDLIRREGRAQLHLSLRLGTVADVHHHLLNRASVRDSFTMPMDDILSRARTVTVGAVPVQTLDAVDTLLHVCIHAALAGGHRLIWLKDVEQAVSREAPAWEDVVDRARSWRAGSLVAVVLRRARDELGCSVPPEVVRSLFRSRAMGWVTAFGDRLWPADRAASGRPTPAVIWAQVVRDTWRSTVASLWTRVMRPLMKKTGRRDAEEDWAHPPDPRRNRRRPRRRGGRAGGIPGGRRARSTPTD